jgi:DNA-binding YbaB/EbfC family protein
MTENPFGGRVDGPNDADASPDDSPEDDLAGYGTGGFDMSALLAQAQQMQSQLQDAQAELAATPVSGTVAGGAVSVTVNGVGELIAVDVKAGQFDGSDPDDLSDLSDMIIAAYRDAKSQADALASEKLGPLAGGFGG